MVEAGQTARSRTTQTVRRELKFNPPLVKSPGNFVKLQHNKPSLMCLIGIVGSSIASGNYHYPVPQWRFAAHLAFHIAVHPSSWPGCRNAHIDWINLVHGTGRELDRPGLVIGFAFISHTGLHSPGGDTDTGIVTREQPQYRPAQGMPQASSPPCPVR